MPPAPVAYPTPAVPEDLSSPVTARLVPVATPMTGVTSVGEVNGALRARSATSPTTPASGSPEQFVRTPAEGVPKTGVVNVGEVAKTAAPVPVSSVKAARRFALVALPKKVATPVPSPDTPVDIGRPVALFNVIVGPVANTAAPVPVSSVSAALRLELEGAFRNVGTPVPRLAIPVATGRPVQYVRVPLVGVPRIGVVSVGVVCRTREPVPVEGLLEPIAIGAVDSAGSTSRAVFPATREDA